MKLARIIAVSLFGVLGAISFAHASDQNVPSLSYSGVVVTSSSEAAVVGKPLILAYGYVWSCRAESHHGWGSGIGYTQGEAASNAMYQCRINTPYSDQCFIVHCH